MTPAPLTLVVGPEEVLIERAISSAVADVRQHNPEAQRFVIDAAEEDSTDALVEALAPTLFGDASVVIIRSAENLDERGMSALLAHIAEPGESVCVVAHAGAAKGKAVLSALRKEKVAEIACPKMRKGRDTLSFLTSEVRRHGRKATSDAIRVLYEAIGHDPVALCAAVSQLCSDVEADPIDEEAVRRYFGGVADMSGYHVSDAVWERRTADALLDVRWVTVAQGQASAGVAVAAALSFGLRALVRVQGMPRNMSADAIAADVGMPVWKVRTALSQVKRWSPERLAAATVRLAGLDVAMKGGLPGQALDVDQKIHALESFVLGFAAD
jgi:DNA polymerase III subunit delta